MTTRPRKTVSQTTADEKRRQHRELAALALAALLVRERRSSRALLSAERRALRRLVAAARGVLERASAQIAEAHEDGARRHGMIVIRRTVPVLQAAIEREVLAARTEARRAARASLPPELAPARHLSDLDALEDDRTAAYTAATSYAGVWGGAALAILLGAGGDDAASVAPRAAIAAQEARLGRIAATEVARAFNDERERVADEAVDASESTDLFRVWSAVLDRRTCSFCFGKDGEVRAAHESFGATPPVHPWCRCVLEWVRVPRPKRLEDVAIDYDLFKQELADLIREDRALSDRHAGRFLRDSMGNRRSPLVLTEKFRREAYARRH